MTAPAAQPFVTTTVEKILGGRGCLDDDNPNSNIYQRTMTLNPRGCCI